MESKWSDSKASASADTYGPRWGEDLALRTYSSRLLGRDRTLVLHGGGNTSVKGYRTNVLGEQIPAIFVKASGHDMAVIEPEGHSALKLEHLIRLRSLAVMDDALMVNEFRTHLFDHRSATPSLETLVHAFLPMKFIDHTHPEAVLALTNQPDARQKLREALGEEVCVVEYVTPGFKLAKAVIETYEAHPLATAIVLINHGLITWGRTAKESYERTCKVVTDAEHYLEAKAVVSLKALRVTSIEDARARYKELAPLLRGLLAERGDDEHRLSGRVILTPLITRETLDFVDSSQGRDLALTPPITSDYLIRTKAFPLWVDGTATKEMLAQAIEDYARSYGEYVSRHRKGASGKDEEGQRTIDHLPRVFFISGVGAVCAGGDVAASRMARDITEQAVRVKTLVARCGEFSGMSEKDLFEMEYRSYQHAKLGYGTGPSLSGRVALVTGAAGAIGTGICVELLRKGCHVALTDLAGDALKALHDNLRGTFKDRVLGVPMDVTSPDSVKQAFEDITLAWGGVDIVVVNAGLAHVSTLEEMEVEAYRRLNRVNTEGTLFVIREGARHFRKQGCGGDVILISTKNVFAPGAGFGAYSATKAASHQLARIASLELAPLDVRVNMVSPDAVFACGERKSGLWQTVGPDRMRARGLDEKGLEEYYRNRNLLKAKITAEHVGRAVVFFAERQTPTTGATIPVDGGLPDASPR